MLVLPFYLLCFHFWIGVAAGTLLPKLPSSSFELKQKCVFLDRFQECVHCLGTCCRVRAITLCKSTFVNTYPMPTLVTQSWLSKADGTFSEKTNWMKEILPTPKSVVVMDGGDVKIKNE